MEQNLSDPDSESESTFTGTPAKFRKVSLIVCLIGAAVSIALFLVARQQAPILLVVLFVGWILAPFVALLFAHYLAKRWTSLTQNVLYCVILMVSAVSLAIYGYQVIWPRQSTPAFYWVAVPLASGLLAIIVVAIGVFSSRRKRSEEFRP